MLAEQDIGRQTSVHDGDTADKLGLVGAPIEGPTHCSQFDPLGVCLWGQRLSKAKRSVRRSRRKRGQGDPGELHIIDQISLGMDTLPCREIPPGEQSRRNADEGDETEECPELAAGVSKHHRTIWPTVPSVTRSSA